MLQVQPLELHHQAGPKYLAIPQQPVRQPTDHQEAIEVAKGQRLLLQELEPQQVPIIAEVIRECSHWAQERVEEVAVLGALEVLVVNSRD